jgi:hypothetical protein
MNAKDAALDILDKRLAQLAGFEKTFTNLVLEKGPTRAILEQGQEVIRTEALKNQVESLRQRLVKESEGTSQSIIAALVRAKKLKQNLINRNTAHLLTSLSNGFSFYLECAELNALVEALKLIQEIFDTLDGS